MAADRFVCLAGADSFHSDPTIRIRVRIKALATSGQRFHVFLDPAGEILDAAKRFQWGQRTEDI